jgi:hypothetical protein
MGLFSRGSRTIVPASVTAILSDYGQADIDSRRRGRALSDPRYGWDNFVGPVHMPMISGNRDEVIRELCDAAQADPRRELAIYGAYRLLSDFDAALADPRFVQLRDASLGYMHSLGFSSGRLNRYEADRWIEMHGDLRTSFDGIIDVVVPSPEIAPDVGSLGPGESRLIALTAPLPDGNGFYAEHRPDGTYIVFSERPRSSDDLTRARYDETYLGTFTSLPELLRAVGAMFGTRPHWADDDLEPYFPGRRG